MERRGVLAAALFISGCGVGWAATAAELWLDVPFVPQQKQGCGPAAVSMVMQYWQQKLHRTAAAAADVDEILSALPPGRHGVNATALLQYMQQHGYRAFAYAGDWDDVEQELAKGRPLIAALKPRGDDELHYVVLAGVNDAEHVVLMNDPAQRKLLKEDDAQFEREWKATGNWTLLAVPELK